MTPTLATGAIEVRRFYGFTLLELLVVLVIAGIMLGVVALTVVPNPRIRLDDEAARLARLFELAEEEAQLTAQPMAWEGDLHGWRFYAAGAAGWRLIDEDVLAPGHWRQPLAALQVIVSSTDLSSARLVFGREAIGLPWRVRLSAQGMAAEVVSDGGPQPWVERP